MRHIYYAYKTYLKSGTMFYNFLSHTVFSKKNKKIGKTLFFDPTYVCPLHCATCNSNRAALAFRGKPHLSVAQLDRIFGEFANEGGNEVKIYGGEPLIVPHIADIVKTVKKHGLSCALSTNAVIATEEKISALVDAGLDSLVVSIDGVGAVYEKVRGKNMFRSFDRGVRSITRVLPEGFSLGFHVTISSINVDGIADVVTYAFERGIRHCSFQYLTVVPSLVDKATESVTGISMDQSLNRWNHPTSLWITKKQMPVLREQIRRVRQIANAKGIFLDIDPALDQTDEQIVFGRFLLKKPCRAFWNEIILGPDGSISPCPMLTHMVLANANNESLRQYFTKNKKLKALRRRMGKDKYLPICSYCCNHAQLMR